MPIYTLGTDVSRYNDNGLPPYIDFKKMAAKGVIYTVIRLTSGITEDRDAEKNVKAAQDAGMIAMGYHWWNYTVDRQAQTAKFLNTYDRLKVVYPALDIENMFQGEKMPQGMKSVNTVDNMMKEILAATGKKCLLYSNGDILKNYLTPKPESWYTYPLWLASPGIFAPTNLYGWSKWTIWQYTWKLWGPDYGTGMEAKDLDGDYFNGTEQELRKFCGLDVINPPIPPNPAPTLEERVSALEKQARAHGWNV
jgi:GH25 family lysozyme M1 (1,4-beta-N-acetylmuramidase)